MTDSHPAGVGALGRSGAETLDLEGIKKHLPPAGFWSHPWERTIHALIAEIERLRVLAPPEEQDTFTESEIAEVLTSLYMDGAVDLVLADRIAALMRLRAAVDHPPPPAGEAIRAGEAKILPRNTRITPDSRFEGEWVAVPLEDFEAARAEVERLRASSGSPDQESNELREAMVAYRREVERLKTIGLNQYGEPLASRSLETASETPAKPLTVYEERELSRRARERDELAASDAPERDTRSNAAPCMACWRCGTVHSVYGCPSSASPRASAAPTDQEVLNHFDASRAASDAPERDTRPTRGLGWQEHELKTWPEYYVPIISGEKTFEIRRDDRGFRVGDILRLREWRRLRIVNGIAEGEYTGRETRCYVSYILSGVGLEPGIVCMGLQFVEGLASPRASAATAQKAFCECGHELHWHLWGAYCQIPSCGCERFTAALSSPSPAPTMKEK